MCKEDGAGSRLYVSELYDNGADSRLYVNKLCGNGAGSRLYFDERDVTNCTFDQRKTNMNNHYHCRFDTDHSKQIQYTNVNRFERKICN